MKVLYRRCLYSLAALTFIAAAWAPVPALADEEGDLIQVLGSEEPAPVKGKACERLKAIGTVRAVGALGSLLRDEEVSHAARFALEVMPYPEAGLALREALDATSGRTKVGIVNSLGERREEASVPALMSLLEDTDAHVALAAVAALGKIGTKKASSELLRLKSKAPPGRQSALSDALLACAEQRLADGDREGASAVYKTLHDVNEPPHIRVAAFRGLAFAADDKAMAVVREGLTGGDSVSESAALGLIVELEGETIAKEIESLLPEVSPRLQAALLRAATQRGEQSLAPTVAEMVKSEHPEVRIAALGALARTGDASSLPLLALVAAEAKGAEQEAAREALDLLQGAGVNEGMLAGLKDSSPSVRVELLRSLAERRVETAVPALLEVVETDGESAVRLAALASLTTLAGDEAVAPLVSLLIEAQSERERKAAEKALASTCGRSPNKALCADKVLAGLTTPTEASVAARCALLRVCGPLGGTRVLETLRAAANDGDEQVRDAAIRALSEYPDF